MMVNEIRKLTVVDITSVLLLYISAGLTITTNSKVHDAVHMFIEETGRL